MTNETTASQPKSIGDDAQFQKRLAEYDAAIYPGQKALRLVSLIALIDSRAPAAQASATIQAAPEADRESAEYREHRYKGYSNDRIDESSSALQVAAWFEGFLAREPKPWLPTPDAINALPGSVRKYIHDLGTLCDPSGMVMHNTLLQDNCDNLQHALIAARSAATIQEPVMVAEPVDDGLPPEVQKLFDQLRPEIDYWCTHRRESNLAALDAIEFRFKVSQARTVRLERAAKVAVSTTHAAPMVADPAGVAVKSDCCPACGGSGHSMMLAGGGPDAEEHLADCVYCKGTGGLLDAYNGTRDLLAKSQQENVELVCRLAATVKAVPSDLTSIRCPVCCGSGSVDEPGDEAGSCESYGCEECHGQGKIIVDAEDVKAVPSEALELAGMVVKATFGDHKILVPRVDLSGKGIGTLVYFAAPLADKTGGGE